MIQSHFSKEKLDKALKSEIEAGFYKRDKDGNGRASFGGICVSGKLVEREEKGGISLFTLSYMSNLNLIKT